MSLKLLRAEADELWSTVGKIDYCEACGENTEVVPHHFVGRTNKTLRWDLRNRVWLCRSCHTSADFSAHGSPTEFKEWFKEARPEDFKYLMERKNIISKFTEEDMKKIIEELK